MAVPLVKYVPLFNKRTVYPNLPAIGAVVGTPNVILLFPLTVKPPDAVIKPDAVNVVPDTPPFAVINPVDVCVPVTVKTCPDGIVIPPFAVLNLYLFVFL